MLNNWPAWLWLLVSALAVYRLTKLITEDTITKPIRKLVKRLGEPWSEGIECPWCVSIWVSGAVVGLALVLPAVWQVAAVGLTFSAVTGLIANHD